MRIVLDTSVIVAAWRSRLGASFEIVDSIGSSLFEIAVSVPLVAEYESALLGHLTGAQRPRHVEALIDHLCAVAVRQKVYFLWRPLLSDPNDDMVVEVAIASQASVEEWIERIDRQLEPFEDDERRLVERIGRAMTVGKLG